MTEPTVSVIMANYNGADHIATALRSVLAQSLTDIEVIFADDASTDTSIEIATTFAAQDARVIVLQTPTNGGPAAARNRALDVARGAWVAIVDSDDIIHPERLERMLYSATELHADGVADDLIYLVADDPQQAQTLLGSGRPAGPEVLTPDRFVDDRPLAPRLGYLKPVLSRRAIGDLRYREDIRIGEDHDFYMRFMLEGGRLNLLPQSYYLYRRHRKSLSYRLCPDDLQDMMRAQDDLQKNYPDISATLKDCFAKRKIRLQHTMAFEALVRHLKRWNIVAAASAIARRPALLGRLANVAMGKVSRRFATRSDAVKADGDIVLSTDAHDLVAGNPRHIKIPQTPDKWSSLEWARLTAATQNSRGQVFVRGAAGLFALGYVPCWSNATLWQEDGIWPDVAERLQATGYTIHTDNSTKGTQSNMGHRGVHFEPKVG